MNQEDMRLAFDKAVIMAVMQKCPLIVVEGKDDLPIYVDIAKTIRNDISVKPIQYYKECSPGCNQIETRFESLNNKYSPGHKVFSYVLGVVDRDAKAFRNEIKTYHGLHYLNWYSFENHFVNKNSLLSVLKHLTSVTSDMLNDNLSNQVLTKINISINKFYYATLEALKNAVDPNYDALIGFSGGYESAFKNPLIKNKLVERRASLDVFAQGLGIQTTNILEFSSFCKGKWHLRYFINEIQNIVVGIHEDCGTKFDICPYCEIDDSDNCLYKVKNKSDVSELIKIIKGNLGNAEFSCISSRIESLAS